MYNEILSISTKIDRNGEQSYYELGRIFRDQKIINITQGEIHIDGNPNNRFFVYTENYIVEINPTEIEQICYKRKQYSSIIIYFM
jgi:cellulose synthase/poly-beta-1,6-N-acetylglucosamine synthase-like glycosyltransferase